MYNPVFERIPYTLANEHALYLYSYHWNDKPLPPIFAGHLFSCVPLEEKAKHATHEVDATVAAVATVGTDTPPSSTQLTSSSEIDLKTLVKKRKKRDWALDPSTVKRQESALRRKKIIAIQNERLELLDSQKHMILSNQNKIQELSDNINFYIKLNFWDQDPFIQNLTSIPLPPSDEIEIPLFPRQLRHKPSVYSSEADYVERRRLRAIEYRVKVKKFYEDEEAAIQKQAERILKQNEALSALECRIHDLVVKATNSNLF